MTMSGSSGMTSKETPTKYPAFGDKLYKIAVQNLPAGKDRGKKTVVDYFLNQSELGFDTSCTYAWLRGELSGSKPLVADNFKRILLFYIGKAGLKTLDEIKGWVTTGPQHYKDLLDHEEIRTVLLSRKITKHPIDQTEEMAERQKSWQRLTSLVRSANPQSNVIVIQGPPGTGKSLLLERLQSTPEFVSQFDQILLATSDAQIMPDKLLGYWFRLLLPDQDWCPNHRPIAISLMRNALRGKQILLLADNLTSPAQINVLKPLCDLGCVLVATTRSLEVSREVPYPNVVELNFYGESDVLEYYTKNYEADPCQATKERLFQLSEMLCYNPLGIHIALRRVVEEGWDVVIQKVKLARDGCKGQVFGDLHKPLSLAYGSLREEDQKKFCSLGTLPLLLNYDEDHLAHFWSIPKKQANEVLVRFEKEAGLARSVPHKAGCWRFHSQVLSYARCLLSEQTLKERTRFRLYPVRMAFHQRRPGHFHFMYKRGVKSEVMQTYWRMINEERKRRRLPIYLAELRRLVDPAYSTDWSIFERLTSNCTLEEYSWGYRTYLEGGMDIILFFVYLALIGVTGGLQHLILHLFGLSEFPILFQAFSLLLVLAALIWGFHIVLRDIRRRYDWGQLWENICNKRKENIEE